MRALRSDLVTVAAVVALVVAALFVIPLVTDSFWLSAFTDAVVFAIPVAGVGFLYSRLGIVSLAQVALMGVGGWVALRVGLTVDLPFEVVALLAGVITCVVGVLVGLPALRLSRLHYALISLMAAGAAQVLFSAKEFPNGGPGFFGRTSYTTAPETMPRPGIAVSETSYFRYVLVAASLMFLLIWLHLRVSPGRAWATLRASAPAAQSVGINVARYRLWGIALAGFTTGVSGTLLAGHAGALSSPQFRASDSIVLFAVALLAGAYTLFGAVLGGAFSQLVPALFDQYGVSGHLPLLLFGIGLVMTLGAAPRGVAGQVADVVRTTRRALRPASGAADA